MTDHTCKCCGQTLPAPLTAGIVMAEGLKHLVEHVRKAGKYGIPTDRLFQLIYGDDPNGGPLTGIKVLHVRVCAANRILRQHGLEVRGEHTGNKGAYGRYILHELKGKQNATQR